MQQTTNQEISFANHQNLILAQKLLSDSPFAARHLLGISEQEANFLTSLTPSQLVKLSKADVLLFSFRFTSNFDVLKKYIEGDDLSLTHMHLLLQNQGA
ncbi:flagellar transcriptional regulator FlhD [Methylophilus sp. QUAN]|uniref:flagellar transcriptional regulator FlhD n=1 Tax=Methylophilus sp. QUAN TaxID=2781020 RepID=UPI00188FE122|nr:flagellar transcriptional regulator FlhD [Methylophilus sp. QUAN]MBF4990998.1 flagellar transcriptional regulator FlhD [Methylophilus sp. QUAN]